MSKTYIGLLINQCIIRCTLYKQLREPEVEHVFCHTVATEAVIAKAMYSSTSPCELAVKRRVSMLRSLTRKESTSEVALLSNEFVVVVPLAVVEFSIQAIKADIWPFKLFKLDLTKMTKAIQ